MRVGFLTDARQIGGSEVWLAEVLPRLEPLGVNPLAAFPADASTRPIRRRLAEAGVQVVTYRGLSELPRPDLWIVSTWFPKNLARLLSELPRPIFALVHDQVEIHYPLGLRYAYRLGYRLLQAPLLRRTDGVITVSRWAAEFLTQVHRIPNVKHVQNGVDTGRFRPPGPGERETLKRKYRLSGTVALLPARFAVSLEKNQLAALLAVRGLAGVTLALAGDGPLYKPLKALATSLGIQNARFLGRVESMPELYRAADLFLFPTLGENQSLATLEAMASGLPVITSPIPAQAELVKNGQEGLTVPPRPANLREAIRRLQEDPALREAMGRRARQRVLASHTLEHTARRLAALLKEVL